MSQLAKPTEGNYNFRMTVDMPLRIVKAFLTALPYRYRSWLYEAVHLSAREDALKRIRLSEEILQGPLSGTKIYSSGSSWNGNLDRFSLIWGAYESEVLKRVVSDISLSTPHSPAGTAPTLIHIGCSDGLMALGLLRNTEIGQAFLVDTDPIALRLCIKNAELNGMRDLIQTFSEAPKSTATPPSSKNFIIIDIEGSEYDLIDDFFIQSFQTATFYIETHQENEWRIEQAKTLIRRLEGSHNVEILQPSISLTGQFSQPMNREFNNMSEYQRFLLMSEGRSHCQTWLIATPKCQDAEDKMLTS